MEVTLHRFLVDFGTILGARSGPKVVLKSEQKSDEKKKGPKSAQERKMTKWHSQGRGSGPLGRRKEEGLY